MATDRSLPGHSRPPRLPRTPRLPAHVGILVGLSTGAYALSLAAVTGLQSGTETAIRAEREPVAAAIGNLKAQHDRLDADLMAAKTVYEVAAGTYAQSGASFQEMEARLGDLAVAVAAINGSAAALPGSVRMPAVSGTVRTASAPGVAATTKASGAP